jgi:hypothetical protein
MTTMVSVPVIRTNADLAVALARIDTLIDAPEGTPEADERATLGILVSVYEVSVRRVAYPLINFVEAGSRGDPAWLIPQQHRYPRICRSA